MTVYNYVRVGPPGGEASIHDAPPEVVAAIECWLEGQAPAEFGRGVAWHLLEEPRLGLLVLRHAISSEDRYALGLVHVVAVPEGCLAEPSAPALTRFFESLYGSPLSIALPRLLGALARATREETTTRVQRAFAGDDPLEALGSEDPGDFARPDREPADGPAARDGKRAALDAVGGFPAEGAGELRLAAAAAPEHATRETPPTQPRRTGSFAAGLGLLFGATLGIALAYSPFVERLLPRFASPAPPNEERLVRLEQRVDRLQEQGRASHRALAELERSHADAVSQLRQVLEERSAAAAAKAAAPAAEPAAATPPVASERRPFRVVVRSARVRAGPSAKERTRGLIARGQRVVVTDRQDAWLEIEPPPGFTEPTWIHGALVEAVEATSEDAALAPKGPPPA